jgi:hypothetical protein
MSSKENRTKNYAKLQYSIRISSWYKITLGQPDHTPPCKGRREKKAQSIKMMVEFWCKEHHDKKKNNKKFFIILL